jgi:hypothetical protein
MASPVITLSAATKAEDLFKENHLMQSAIRKGQVVCYRTGNGSTDDEVVLPGSALAGRIAGVALSAGALVSGVYAAGVAGTDRVVFQKLGRAVCILAPNTACVRGDVAVVADSTGRVRPRLAGEPTSGRVGKFHQSRGSSSSEQMVEVDLELGDVDLVLAQFQGFASTNSQNNTRYLSAAGTGAPSASAVVVGVVPPGGGTLRNLTCVSQTAPGGSDTDQFIVYRNPLVAGAYTGWAATSVTATITGSAVEAKDASHTQACNEGDLIAIAVVASATSLGAGRVASVQLT